MVETQQPTTAEVVTSPAAATEEEAKEETPLLCQDPELLALFERVGAKFIRIERLDKEVEIAEQLSKYCVIFDRSGNCNVFFRLKRTLRDVDKEIVANALFERT